MILLYHDQTTDGMVATSSHHVAGDHLPARRYAHEGHYLIIDGPAHVVAHDAEEICRIPGYRLATAEESDTYNALKKKRGRITEKADASKEE